MRLNASIPGVPHTFSDVDANAVRVTTASESAVRDLAAIHAGTPAFTLMLQAGTRATEVIVRRYSHLLANGVLIYAGSGNNGGDAYVVAAQLARMGVRVWVIAAKPPRTPNAIRAAALCDSIAQQVGVRCTTLSGDTGADLEGTAAVDGTAAVGAVANDTGEFRSSRRVIASRDHSRHVPDATADNAPRLIVDGLLGTGHEGALRGTVSQCAADIANRRAHGATIVSLDIPSGVNATTGARATGSVCAQLTITFGTIKRGLFIDRSAAGAVILVDIGLGVHALGSDRAWHYLTSDTLRNMVPVNTWNAYKGQRGYLALVGGATGMAGAITLASRAALHSGAGLVRTCVEAPGMPAVQRSVPQAIATTWTQLLDDNDEPVWGTALALGPGLGRSTQSQKVLDYALDRYHTIPTVIDADALTLLAHTSLSNIGADRDMVMTPHAGEFARLTGAPTPTGWEERAGAVCALAKRTGATILLKGTPTLIAAPDDEPATVVARGTAVLATGGSGDMLTGIIGALLAQGVPSRHAAILGATVHGMAAERATALCRGVRGVTLDDVLGSMADTWHEIAHPPAFSPGVIVELPLAQGTL